MVGPGHQEADPGRDRAVAADDQALGSVRVEDGVAFERCWIVRVVVVAVLTDHEVRIAHERLEKHDTSVAGDWVERHWVRGGVHRDEWWLGDSGVAMRCDGLQVTAIVS